MIDFGLSSNSTSSEDKAVDLYVLERAFASTHPSSEHLFAEVMRAYQDTLVNDKLPYDAHAKAEKGTVTGPTHWPDIKRKVEEGKFSFSGSRSWV
jgi:TP53 regulating kinase-like protein